MCELSKGHIIRALTYYLWLCCSLLQERDSYKQVLESYESEMTVPIGQVTNNRVKQLEQIVEGYQQQLASFEEELDQKNQLLGQTKVQCHQVCCERTILFAHRILKSTCAQLKS